MRKPKPIDVLVVDDHPMMRDGIRARLDQAADIQVGAEAGRADEALRMIFSRHFDVVILDVQLPDRYGIDALAEIRRRRPKLPVLILSVEEDEELALRCLQMGASGYLAKKAMAAELIEAVRDAVKGQPHFSATVVQRAARRCRAEELGAPEERLSRRELETYLLLGANKTLSEIAAILHVHVNTVRTCKTRIFEKCGFGSMHYLMARYEMTHPASAAGPQGRP
jgi:DNA-binding NarL/FixJ family response regulator